MSARLEFPPLPAHNPAARVPPGGYLGLNRRSRDPIDILSRQLDAVCVNAVSPLEIAAALEMDGMTDQLAQEKYGVEDVFALADALYERVPFRDKLERKPLLAPVASSVEAIVEIPAAQLWRSDLARGLLYLLSGLLASAFGGYNPQATTLGLIISSVGAWAWSQSMVRVSYLLLGRGQPETSRRALRLFMLLGVLLIVAFAWACSQATGFGAAVVVVALVQSTYALATVVYLTLNKDRALWIYAAPGFAFGLLNLLVRSAGFTPNWLSPVTLGIESLAVLAVVVGAFRITRVKRAQPRFFELIRLGLKSSDFLDTIPFGLYGALCALLLAVDALVSVFMPEFTVSAPGISLIPLVLVTGVAEWQLRMYRESQMQLLKRTTILSLYGLRCWGLFLRALGKYSLALIGVSVLFAAGMSLVRGFSTPFSLGVIANCILGIGFFGGFVLLANDRLRLAVFGVGLALLVRLGLLMTPYALFAPVLAAITVTLVLLVTTKSVVVRISKF